MSACASALAQQWLDQYAARDRLFGVLTEPMWRMLLKLRHQAAPMSVTGCCVASGAPAGTALNHLGQLLDCGWIARVANPDGKRSEQVDLTDFARETFDRLEGWA